MDHCIVELKGFMEEFFLSLSPYQLFYFGFFYVAETYRAKRKFLP